MTQDKYVALVQALRSADTDMGIYPAAVKGYNDERDYEQRDGFKNGWNAAVIEYGKGIDRVIEQASTGINDDVQALLAAEVATLEADGSVCINFSDTWAWACSDSETATVEEIPEVARLFRAWGWPGLLYWCSVKRKGERSAFKDINRFIDFVAREEAFIREVPSSSKRAYMDLPEKTPSADAVDPAEGTSNA